MGPSWTPPENDPYENCRASLCKKRSKPFLNNNSLSSVLAQRLVMEEYSTELEPPSCIQVDVEPQPEALSPGSRLVTEKLPGNPRNSQQNFDLMVLVIAFCLSTAVGIAQISTQTRMPLPPELHLVSLSVVLAFGATVVAKYASSKLPSLSRVLEHVGAFFAATAFMFSVTLTAPLCLKGSNIVLSQYARDAQVAQAEFVKSSVRTEDCPAVGLTEFALVGRSTVGKSSLLNSLTCKPLPVPPLSSSLAYVVKGIDGEESGLGP
ncbi:hypothetical protein RJ639_034876 [Escallonia herrerae]|uniref:Uncharacterized protein n=1 Tax=Escallonia herrerae TaxID=1293975 RepID=A0AA88WSQ2_9ASTE|nr:hypothetical protein RJ639_034876 [Escallonia herrerae]